MQEAIKSVLKKSKIPMTSKQITEEIRKSGNYPLTGKTPVSSVCARIITNIKEKGENSIFKRVENGFMLR